MSHQRERAVKGRPAACRIGIVLLLGSGIACGSLDNCPEGQDTLEVRGGKTDTALNTYDSAPGNRPLAEFPAKTTLRFEHGLGTTPLPPQVFLSFRAEGTAGDSSLSPASGNSALITCLDARVIELKNDTCEHFFVRLITTGVDPDAAPDECATPEP
jgi:hypothetical protein